MSIFDSKRVKTLKGIVKEYERVFNLPVPDTDDGTLLKLKHIQLEKLAFAFDELNGYQEGITRGWDTRSNGYFIPNLTRYLPVIKHVGCNLGSADIDRRVSERYYKHSLTRVSSTLKKKRYKQLKDSNYFLNIPIFKYSEEYLYPNPDKMRRF